MCSFLLSAQKRHVASFSSTITTPGISHIAYIVIHHYIQMYTFVNRYLQTTQYQPSPRTKTDVKAISLLQVPVCLQSGCELSGMVKKADRDADAPSLCARRGLHHLLRRICPGHDCGQIISMTRCCWHTAYSGLAFYVSIVVTAQQTHPHTKQTTSIGRTSAKE